MLCLCFLIDCGVGVVVLTYPKQLNHRDSLRSPLSVAYCVPTQLFYDESSPGQGESSFPMTSPILIGRPNHAQEVYGM